MWAAGIYAAVQVIEGSFINPFVQQRAASIPPAHLLSAQLLTGLTMGVLGVMLATPLLVVAAILVRGLYVEWIERGGQGSEGWNTSPPVVTNVDPCAW